MHPQGYFLSLVRVHSHRGESVQKPLALGSGNFSSTKNWQNYNPAGHIVILLYVAPPSVAVTSKQS